MTWLLLSLIGIAAVASFVVPLAKMAGPWYARRRIVRYKARLYIVPRIAGGGPLRKHGAHYFPLDLPAIAVGAAADTSTLFTYQFNTADLGVYDPTQEYVLDAVLTTDSNVTGAATNNFAVQVSHYNSSGTLKDQVVYTFGNTVNATAFVPISLFGAAAGALTNPTGGTIGNWALQSGDSIVVKRVSNGTGLASPAFTVTLVVGPKA